MALRRAFGAAARSVASSRDATIFGAPPRGWHRAGDDGPTRWTLHVGASWSWSRSWSRSPTGFPRRVGPPDGLDAPPHASSSHASSSHASSRTFSGESASTSGASSRRGADGRATPTRGSTVMTPALERRLEAVSARHDALVAALVADPPPRAAEIARINKELARAERVVRAYAAVKERRHEKASLEQVIAESAGVDAEMAQMAEDELAALEETTPALEETLAHLLLPADEADDSGVILEVRAGAGGDEAALFAADLLRMYEMFARKTGWRFELVAANASEAGGVKEATASLAGDDVYGRLKFESGVHRVQRVPATETQGRVHTSTASVAVLPQAETVELDIRDDDLKIDTMRASGAGGQHVNTTNSAVRITHVPTGVTVVMQDERSQHKNKDKAMKVLRARVYELERRKLADARADQRRSLIGSGDRSERVRTYNYKEGRVKDHRVNLLLNDLPGLLDGGDALGEMLDALKLEERRQLMAEFSVSSE